jgi:broad specificity phosphatase PhoE
MSEPRHGSWSSARPGTASTDVVLLRHGDTRLTPERRFSGTGSGDPGLSPVGRDQTRRAARGALLRSTPFTALVCSPLRRCRETAAIVADELDLPVTVEDDLREADFGAWEGLTFDEAAERDPEHHRAWLADPTLPPPGGESFDSVAERVREGLDAVVAAHPGETVVLVSHVTPIKMALRFALDAGPQMLYRLHLDLACLSIVDHWPDGGASVRLVNDTSYLA